MVQAYILVQTEVGKAAEVARLISEIKGVTLAEDVTGPYDVIVRAEAPNVDDLGRLACVSGCSCAASRCSLGSDNGITYSAARTESLPS